ncbi:hypothetical protein [Pseudomonas alvandae]|uniref:hypothetical protein n=1 Tax=Pseudomonas canavaninivorans TaxID=2842348 RepID=UPI00215E8080|nr:hypothetical protein [Pseudomonas canavaninivorans]UVM72615.1 hypothetical protein LOY40_00075 [Pseudomonas canavaninivorans]
MTKNPHQPCGSELAREEAGNFTSMSADAVTLLVPQPAKEVATGISGKDRHKEAQSLNRVHD